MTKQQRYKVFQKFLVYYGKISVTLPRFLHAAKKPDGIINKSIGKPIKVNLKTTNHKLNYLEYVRENQRKIYRQSSC